MSNVNKTVESGISSLKWSLIFAFLSLLFNPLLIYYAISFIFFVLLGPNITIENNFLLIVLGFIINFSLYFGAQIFNILSMVKENRGHNKLLGISKEIDTNEYRWEPIAKKYNKIILITIVNLILILIFINMITFFLFPTSFPVIIYLIILFYYKIRTGVIWKYWGKLNKEFPQVKAQLQEVQKLISQNEFDEARRLLSALKSQAKSLHIKSFKDEKFFIDFDQLNKSLILSEKKYKERQKIHTSLLMFSKKYPRILLKELVDDVKISQYQVENITKQFISDNLIPAKYDEETKAIEFTFIEGEIDELMKRFEDWEQTGEGKKI